MRLSVIIRSSLICAGIALNAIAHSANAQQSPMPGMNMPTQADTNANASTQAFKDADEKMMKGMSEPPYTGDTDKDFVTHMVPHHQGAIDMAEVELKYGKDPALKRLAKNIISAQREEIRFMQQWEAKHGVK